MATFDKGDKPAGTGVATPAVGGSANGGKKNWAEFVPKYVGTEDSMSPEDSAKVWSKLYSAVGASTESERTEVRMACYVYATLNGTSRVGNYRSTVALKSGKSFGADVIPRAAGELNVRRFFRGNMDEAYEALKATGVMESYPRFLSKANSLGVDAKDAFALSDYMSGCPNFTPTERAANERSFRMGIEKGRRARGGHTLEEVEEDSRMERLVAQGPNAAESQQHEFHF